MYRCLKHKTHTSIAQKECICEVKKLDYPGSMLIISHNSMFIAQSGPISISLVALSAQAAALPVMSLDFDSNRQVTNFPAKTTQKLNHAIHAKKKYT